MKKTAKIFAAAAAAAVVLIIGTFLPEPQTHYVYSDNGRGITIEQYLGHRPYVNIPDTIDGKPVTVIGESAFGRSRANEGWLRPSGVKIPKTVTEIGESAFFSCPLKSLKLPESISKIGKYAFAGTDIKRIKLPDTLTEVPEGCFYCCFRLNTVNLENIRVIGDKAFAYCGELSLSGLRSNNCLEYLGESAFEYCESLDFSEIPETVVYIGGNAFLNTPFGRAQRSLEKKEKMTVINGSLLYSYNDDDPEPVIPENITVICGNAFEKSCIKHIEIPENVKYIGGYAFWDCTKLESIDIPDSARLCGEGTFKNCESLKYARLGCEELKYHTFYGCKSLSEVEFTEKPRIIGDGAFTGCTSLKSLSDENAEKVDACAFMGCTALESVYLPKAVEFGIKAFRESGIKSIELADGVKSIDVEMFFGCKRLKSAKLPQSVTAIGENAFCGCEALDDISFPKKLESIGNKAFFEAGIKAADMPDTVKELGNSAFFNCRALKRIRFSNALDTVPIDCCNGCDRLSDVVLPQNVKRIGDNAFWKDKSLEHIYLPDGLEAIGLNAFMDTGIWEVFIPDSVKMFNMQAFCCEGRSVLIMHTESCAAAEQIEQARQWGLVHDRYNVDIVKSRSDEEAIYNSSKNN